MPLSIGHMSEDTRGDMTQEWQKVSFMYRLLNRSNIDNLNGLPTICITKAAQRKVVC